MTMEIRTAGLLRFFSFLCTIWSNELRSDAFVFKSFGNVCRTTSETCLSQRLVMNRGVAQARSNLSNESLTSLFDESIVLHSSISSADMVENSMGTLEKLKILIEDIAFSLHAEEEESKKNTQVQSIEIIQSALDDAILMVSKCPNVSNDDITPKLLQLAKDYQNWSSDSILTNECKKGTKGCCEKETNTVSKLSQRLLDIRDQFGKQNAYSSAETNMEQIETMEISAMQMLLS